MFDKLKASRELLLWGAVGSAAFLTVMGLVRWIYEASGDTGSWRGASLSVGTLTLPPLPLLIGLLALAACVLIAPITKNAHVASLILLGSIGLGALVRLITVFIMLFGDGIDGGRKAIMFFEALGQFALVGVIGFVTFLLMGALAPRQAPGPMGYGQPAPGQYGQNPPMPPAPAQRPTWQPNQASGGGWNRAGDAASGASASTWGTPGQQPGGWQPTGAPQGQPAPMGQPELGQPQQGMPQSQPSAAAPSWQSQSAAQGPVAEPGSAQSAEEGTVLRPAPQAGQWQPPATNPNPNPGQWNDGRQN